MRDLEDRQHTPELANGVRVLREEELILAIIAKIFALQNAKTLAIAWRGFGLVEAAGIEPASASPLPMDLHV